MLAYIVLASPIPKIYIRLGAMQNFINGSRDPDHAHWVVYHPKVNTWYIFYDLYTKISDSRSAAGRGHTPRAALRTGAAFRKYGILKFWRLHCRQWYIYTLLTQQHSLSFWTTPQLSVLHDPTQSSRPLKSSKACRTVVSSPSVVWGGTPAEIKFGTF